MFSWLSKFILKCIGWKIKGEWPAEKKLMIIVVPHTSNWDFPLGVLLRSSLNKKVNFVGKTSIFKGPFGFIFKALGGIPVDRSKRNNFVDSVVDLYNSREELNIQIAPEGTRKKVDRLKTGFYYIAKGANIPILMIKFNFEKKEFELGSPLMPTNIETDMPIIDEFYRNTKGFHLDKSYNID